MAHNDEKLNRLVDELMANDVLEQPSSDFTNNLMSHIETISHSSITVYKPLISKTGWVVIFMIISAIVAYVLSVGSSESSGLFENITLFDNIENPLANLSFNVSKTVLYATVLFALMVGIQIPLLKNYLNKQLSV